MTTFLDINKLLSVASILHISKYVLFKHVYLTGVSLVIPHECSIYPGPDDWENQERIIYPLYLIIGIYGYISKEFTYIKAKQKWTLCLICVYNDLLYWYNVLLKKI